MTMLLLVKKLIVIYEKMVISMKDLGIKEIGFERHQSSSNNKANVLKKLEIWSNKKHHF